MEQDMNSDWESTLTMLLGMPKDKLDHFARLLLNLAHCYEGSSGGKALVLINNGESLLTFSAGATELEAADMLQLAYSASNAHIMRDAPPKDMMN